MIREFEPKDGIWLSASEVASKKEVAVWRDKPDKVGFAREVQRGLDLGKNYQYTLIDSPLSGAPTRSRTFSYRNGREYIDYEFTGARREDGVLPVIRFNKVNDNGIPVYGPVFDRLHLVTHLPKSSGFKRGFFTYDEAGILDSVSLHSLLQDEQGNSEYNPSEKGFDSKLAEVTKIFVFANKDLFNIKQVPDDLETGSFDPEKSSDEIWGDFLFRFRVAAALANGWEIKDLQKVLEHIGTTVLESLGSICEEQTIDISEEQKIQLARQITLNSFSDLPLNLLNLDDEERKSITQKRIEAFLDNTLSDYYKELSLTAGIDEIEFEAIEDASGVYRLKIRGTDLEYIHTQLVRVGQKVSYEDIVIGLDWRPQDKIEGQNGPKQIVFSILKSQKPNTGFEIAVDEKIDRAGFETSDKALTGNKSGWEGIFDSVPSIFKQIKDSSSPTNPK